MVRVEPWKSRIVIGVFAFALACGEDAAEPEETPSRVPDAGGRGRSDADAVQDARDGGDPPNARRNARDAALPDAAEAGDPGDPSREGGAVDERDASSRGEGSAGANIDPSDPNPCRVQSIPDALRTSYRLDSLYERYADADGVPVVASDEPSEEAIRRACLLVLDYASVRAEVRDALLSRKVRFIMMASSEKTVDFPEYAALGDLDWRARGLGGVTDAICAEENVLCDRATDRWRGESICVHEYAHTMHSGAWGVAIPDFNARLEAAFRAATASGKYANTYAGSKVSEYLAEGVQDWYNTNLQSATPNGVHNHINTRAELEEYDPTLYALLKEVLPDQPSFRDCYYYDE